MAKRASRKVTKGGGLATGIIAGVAALSLLGSGEQAKKPAEDTPTPNTSIVYTIETEPDVIETTEYIADNTMATERDTIQYTYVINKNSMKFHYSDCSGAKKISDNNRGSFTGTRDDAIKAGYDSCGICKP